MWRPTTDGELCLRQTPHLTSSFIFFYLPIWPAIRRTNIAFAAPGPTYPL